MKTDSIETSPKTTLTAEEKEALIMENLNFAYSVVAKEFSKYTGKIREELNAAAACGLVHAAGKYNPSSNNVFITYAVYWIRYYINEQIRFLYPVKMNQNFLNKRNKVSKAIESYKKDHDGEIPSAEWLSKNTGMSERQVNSVLRVNGGKNFSFIQFGYKDDDDGVENQTGDDKLMYEYLTNASKNDIDQHNDIHDCHDILNTLKDEVTEEEFQIFTEVKLQGMSLTDAAKKHNLPFPASADYIVKKLLKKCKEIAGVKVNA